MPPCLVCVCLSVVTHNQSVTRLRSGRSPLHIPCIGNLRRTRLSATCVFMISHAESMRVVQIWLLLPACMAPSRVHVFPQPIRVYAIDICTWHPCLDVAQIGRSALDVPDLAPFSSSGVLTDILPLAIGRRVYPPHLSRYNLVSESLHGRTSEANHAQGLMHFPKVNDALREYTRLFPSSEERMPIAKV